MENKFIKVTCITNGHEWDVIINENDIERSRWSYVERDRLQ